MKQSLSKETIERVINNIASDKEAMLVAEWFSSTDEGRQYLLNMIDKDAELMVNDPTIENSISKSQSNALFDKIKRLI